MPVVLVNGVNVLTCIAMIGAGLVFWLMNEGITIVKGRGAGVAAATGLNVNVVL